MSSVQESFVKYLEVSIRSFLDEPAINPLYVVPVVSVLALCLFVYAIGVRSSPTVPPTLALFRDETKSVNKKSQPKKNKSKPKPVEKKTENGLLPNETKPKAVVKPLKVEKKSTPVIREVIKNPQDEEIQDLSTGDWVTVVSDRTKKAQKSAQKQSEVVEEKPSQVVEDKGKASTNTKNKKEEKKPKKDKKSESEATKKEEVPVKPPTPPPVVDQSREVVDWTAEEPEEFMKDVRDISVKNQGKKKNPKKVLESQLSRESVEKLPPPQPSVTQGGPSIVSYLEEKPAPKDKITSEILAQYDSVTSTTTTTSKKESKKTNTNKKADNNKKAKEQPQQQQPGQQPAKKVEKADPVAAPQKTSSPAKTSSNQQKQKKSDSKKKTESSSKNTSSSGVIAEMRTPELDPLPPQPNPAPSNNGSTDITDTTESDPSEGEFKVVRKRKARRE